ncbi:hypothetical protein E7744_10450 [Citricoccus sp. SGAir0253]|uniref:hypothetical protein n=1 Tax=Citricoccus sp. SGAir0253 TaxID=2567881 RepID=UPI0010CCB7FE|nr:hypothetical protein [Citricoccus sp. SGAir0253]QCU78529.1 hypothetical protein E7744_10450 [Citricoccus sp. SGAir0253]
MTRRPPRPAARALPALLGTGVLAVALAACGGPGDGGPSTTPAGTASSTPASSTPASSTPASSTPASGTSSGTPASATPGGASPTVAPTGSAAGSGTASPGGDARAEAALVAVLGDQAQVLRGEQFEQIARSAQGLAEGMTVTPAECGRAAAGGGAGDLPEGTDVVGGIRVDTRDPAAPSSDLLSVTTFPDEAAAERAVASARDDAARCPEYTVEMDDGITADATVAAEDLEAEADEALAVTVTVVVDIEGAELPAGTESTTTTSLYVRDGERLVSYAGSVAGEEPVPPRDGLELVDALRAELDG